MQSGRRSNGLADGGLVASIANGARLCLALMGLTKAALSLILGPITAGDLRFIVSVLKNPWRCVGTE